MVISTKPFSYHGLETCVMSVTMVTLFYSSTSVGSFPHGKHNPFPCMYMRDLMSLCSSFYIKWTITR